MSLLKLGFKAASSPSSLSRLSSLAFSNAAPAVSSSVLPRARDFGATPFNRQQKQMAPRKAKGGSKGPKSGNRASAKDDEVDADEDGAENVIPVHARRTRISMADHFEALAIANRPVDVNETGDPLENIQEILSRWNKTPEPAQLWTQYQRLIREGDVASLGAEEFNTILGMFSQGEGVTDAVWKARAEEFGNVLSEIANAGVELDSQSYSHIIRFYGKAKQLEQVEKFVGEATDGGLKDEADVALATLEAYCNCRSFDNARSVFDDFRMANPDISSLREFYGVLIDGLAAVDDIESALKLFEEMQKEPNYRQPARNFTTTPLLEYYARKGDLTAFLDLFDKLTPVYLNRPDQRAWKSRIEAEVNGGRPADAVKTFFRHIRNKTVIKPDALLSAIPGFVASGQLNVLLRVFLAMESRIPFRNDVFGDALAKAITDPAVFMSGLTKLTDASKGPFIVIKSIVIKPYEAIPSEVRGMFFKMYADALIRAGDIERLSALMDEATKESYKFFPLAKPGFRVPSWPVNNARHVYELLIQSNAEQAKPGQKPVTEGGNVAQEKGLPKATALYQDLLMRKMEPTQNIVESILLAYLNAQDGPGAMHTLDQAVARGYQMPPELLSRLAKSSGLTEAQMDVVKITLKEGEAVVAERKAEAKAKKDAEKEAKPVVLF